MTTSQHPGTLELPATDPDALTRLERFGGIKLLDEMIALFLLNARERLTVAVTGLGPGDAAAIENAMHSLKSSSAQLGALRLSRLSEQAETIARVGTLTECAPVLEQCHEELTRVDAWLTGIRAERSG